MSEAMPFHKYRMIPWDRLTDRTWPDQLIDTAPVWCSVDLRDGNQALAKPMDVESKLEMFKALVKMGFKEIEVGFPSAAKTEFKFVRRIIEEDLIPDDVAIQVLTQARPHLIDRTFESVAGAKNVIFHVYNSTSRAQRKMVFQKDESGIIDIAVQAVRQIKARVADLKESNITLEYSPESFTGTELAFAYDVCAAVLDEYQPQPAQPVIINLPATVELTPPHVYADRIEWMTRRLTKKWPVIISVHTHNDRGTGLAAAEMAVMAGATRVEGTLFGNGERTGNMDIVTMALNLMLQGVDPKLDLRQMSHVRRMYERSTGMEVPPRHPYAGDLVFTAFSGSHQDAIRKGMTYIQSHKEPYWEVPYLPVDPRDIGRTYEAMIRINSQSGKGGIAFVLEQNHQIKLPKSMQPDFAGVVQAVCDRDGRELSVDEIYELFQTTYLNLNRPMHVLSCDVHTLRNFEDSQATTAVRLTIDLDRSGQPLKLSSEGVGPIDAMVTALAKELNLAIEVLLYDEHAIGSGAQAEAMAYMGIRIDGQHELFGCGRDVHISVASLKALVSAINRYLRSV